jgi:hypothetical protein
MLGLARLSVIVSRYLDRFTALHFLRTAGGWYVAESIKDIAMVSSDKGRFAIAPRQTTVHPIPLLPASTAFKFNVMWDSYAALHILLMEKRSSRVQVMVVYSFGGEVPVKVSKI